MKQAFRFWMTSCVAVVTSALGGGRPAQGQERALSQSSRFRVPETVERIEACAAKHGLSVFTRVEPPAPKPHEDQREFAMIVFESSDGGTPVLLRDVENAQRSYDAVLARLTQTSLESQTTQSNIYVLTQAQPPLDASSPKVVLNTLMAIAIGSVLAVGATLVLELLDRRVRALEDVTAAVGLPVLGVMPLPAPRRALGGRRIPLMQQRLLAALPSPPKGQ